MKKFYLLCLLALIVVSQAFSSFRFNAVQSVLNDLKTYIGSFRYGPTDDFDGDGVINQDDIDDDNDGVPDAVESPACFYTATDWNTGAKPASGLTISSGLSTTNGNFNQLLDGVSNVNAVTFTSAQSIQNANVYLFTFVHPVRIDALYLQFNTTSQFANTTKIQGSNTNNGSDWMDLSAAIIQTPAINTTVNGFVSVSSSIKYPVTLNTTTAYKYIRITGVAASNVAAQNASEVYFDFNLAAYVASSYPKATCVDANIDGDAAPPHMDLDSDGDGCSDAYESGATTDKTTNYSFPYIDTNGDGLVNAVDPDGNGIVNYTSTYGFYALASYFKACADTDGDGVLDINDLDDDNDGIPDKVECPDLFVNMGANGGFSGTADALPNWYVGVTTTALPITESFTPTVIPVPYNRDVYNYGVGSGTQVNSPLTGGLFDLYESGNPATGLQFVLQEGDPQHPIVNKLANPLIAGATYNFSFDLGNRASGSANKYIVLLYNADTKMPEKILLSGVLNTLPAYNSIPSYVNFTGSFIPSSSANYYLLFYPSISGGAADDFVIDRVAVGAATISVCDQDGDGIPNFLDLDSDGDGCSDLIEAGVSPSTDVFTPGATNNFGGSYGISNPSGSQLNPNGTDANNNGLNDSVENGLSGNVNYISYYNFYALTASINLCSDFDNDGKADFIDIDDDNDGVPDAIESPGCFYTQAEAVKITSVTSALTQYSTNVIANSYDNNVVTESAFLPNQDWIGKTIFNISIPAPIAISSVNFDIGDWYLSTGTGSTFKLQGGDGQIWEDLSVAMSNTTTADFSINNTLHVGKAYSRYRIVGVAGTSYYSGVNEITLTPYQYNASQHPKASCTGSDINGNGKPNHQDLDSDGDGCSDAYEAGATSVKTANYKFAASPDANNNGLNDTVENGATGTINYTYLLYAYDASLSLCVDTDGDGILDLVDIDDDNDGIPDIMEESCIVNVASKTGIVVSKPSTINYNFDGTQTLANLVDGVDANDYIIYSPSGTLNNAEWFRVEFTTPKVLTQWEIGQYSGQTLFATTSTYKVQGSNDGISWTDVTATLTYSNTGSGQSSQANSNIATFEQNNNAYKYYRYFGITGTSGGGWATEFFFREKNCTELDTDGDGIPNRLDLDSDGDGCSDSYEAGATTDLSPNFAFTSAVGANGLADVKETGVDSGTINYISTYTQYAIASNLALCADSDGDGISDIIDIDDDNDGILDAVESPACFYTGTEANTILGITSPLNGSTGKPLANTEIATMHNGSVSDATPYSFAASQTAAVGAPVFTIQYPTAIVLSSVTVTQAASGITATGFGKLYGSNDGISYTLLTSGTNGIALNTASVIFANTNTAAYKYYQIRSIGTVLAGNATAITIGTGSIQEITSVMAVSPAYNPSAHPKPNCSNDIDGDGIPNHLDLDSDGDGCSDALEAGATTDTTPNYVFTGAVGANGLIDTKETSAESGVVNYTSTYHQFAIAKNLASCVDTDGDGLNDIVDIDDDNDGIPDAIESPGCFFSYGEISVPASVTSTVANTGTISNLYDTNRATSFNFTASAAITGLTLLELTPQFPLEATALQLEMNTSAQTAFNASSLTIEGWNGTSWVTLMPAFNPLAAPNLVSFNFHTFTFSQNQNAKYSKFRIQGVSGTVTANLIREVRLIPAALYVPSAYPKPNCLDDNDGDGIPNHQDLDSDGDGCFDKLEAKVPGATLNGSYTDGLTVPANTTGNVGVNGLANTLETVADNGILNYNPAYQNAINVKLAACTDTDGDGIPDLIDIDDDNDGVLDTNEGYSTNEVAIKPTSNAFAFTSCAAPAGVLNNTVTFTTNGGTLGNATVADGFNYTEKGTNIEVGDKYTLTFATPVILSKLMVNSVFSPIGEFTVTYNDNTVATKLPIAIVPGASPSDYGYVNVSGKLYSYNDAVYGPYIADLNWGGSSNGQAGGILSFPTLDVSKKVKSITFTIVGIPVGGTTPLAALVSPIIREDCYLDTDNDGIPNHLDLDSDGDECTDAVEAATSGQTGVTMLTGTVKNGSGGAVTSTKNNPNAVVAGPYGSNGFADVLQNPSNADAYNYTYTYSKALDNTIKDCCPVIANNTIAGDQSTCNNITPELLTGSTPTVDPTGATVLYKWMSSTTSATTGFSDITSGGTSKDYSFSGPLNQTTYFKRMAYSSGCPEESSNVITITVTPGAIAGILSGNDNICVNGTTAFSSTISGGTWTSNHPEVASIVASTGVITGLAPGTAIMTYTVAGSGGCGNAIATRLVTVNAAPVTGTLSGTQNICVLASTTFSSTISGGNWATDNPGVATVGASTGLVNGVSAGTATISYTVTGAGDCPDVIATRLVTVALAPVAGTLSGNQNICVGGASTFTSTSTGGTWSSNASSIASIDPLTGAISGLAAGTATMTYTVAGSGGCGNAIVTRDVTVTAAAVAGTLSGVQNICAGGTSTFSSTINGGSWSSGDLEVATIDPTTGLINGLTAGTATMTYTVTGTGGCGDATVSRSVTVTAAPVAGTLSGNQNICVDATTTFSSTTGGGSWSSGNPGVATINASTGEILGLTAGTATMTYTVAGSGGCADVTDTRVVTVTAAAVAGTLSGIQGICAGGTTTFSSTITGGSWSSGNTAVATIDPTTGVINGLTAGTSTMTYTVAGAGGCGNATVTRI
uniref:Ig-like domain-containing protein n=1 Tax=Pedobacter gandavensis TaxID=2679963 RepID=UPI0029310868